ncbi:unknown protein [Cronobacter turicensis z3032]|uniref:Uncharacterized protein n=1 Tax=Cronobacter turicensis (strain DSM 18703 / CCUG 55852 / LMG 23827 / z3032) TaxID=693216 RepID=C9XYX5_CROTZ|nr:unknown protein [Cronobacter turicensis z3032]
MITFNYAIYRVYAIRSLNAMQTHAGRQRGRKKLIRTREEDEKRLTEKLFPGEAGEEALNRASD